MALFFYRFLKWVQKSRGCAFPSQHIVVIRLDEIGDLTLTIPFLRALKNEFPNAPITLITKHATQDLLTHCPYIDKLIGISTKTPKLLKKWGRLLRYAIFTKKHLSYLEGSTIYLPRFDVDEADGIALASFIKPVKIIGFCETTTPYKQQINSGLNLLLTSPIQRASYPVHEAQRNLCLLYSNEKINKISLKLEAWLPQQDINFAKEKIFNLKKNSILVGIALKASKGNKTWPFSYFLKLAELLNNKYCVHFILIGGSDALNDSLEFCKNFKNNSSNFTMQTSLKQTQSLLSLCDVGVFGDTGPLHLASCIDLSLIALYYYPKNGCTTEFNSRIRFEPLSSTKILMQPDAFLPPCLTHCSYSYPHCITQIKPENVFQELEVLFQSKGFITKNHVN